MKVPIAQKFLACGLFGCIALNPILSVRADYSSTVQGLNPLAYYRLNETASVPLPDLATNSGTLGAAGTGFYVGNVTHPADGALVANAADTAASFAGGNVAIPYRPELNPRTPFTVECWAYKQPGSGYPLCAFSSMSTAINRQGWLLYDNDSNWQFRIGDGAGYVATTQGGTATVGQWYHLAGVYDGANAILYVNGVAVSTVPQSRPYDPNPSYQTQIGTAANPAFTRNFSGTVDEAAIYTNALSPAEILAHYQNGISASPSTPYNQLVLAQHPVAYYRLNEPTYIAPDPTTLPTAANLGTLGAAINGTFEPGSQPGLGGPPGAAFGADNKASGFDGFNGYVSIGNPDGLNFTNKITVMAWFKPTASDGLRDIVAHGYITSPDCQEIFFRINAGAYQFGSCESSEGASADALAAQDVGKWVFLTGTFDGAKWNLYRYGELVASSAGTVGAGTVGSLWSIGSRGDPTLGDGRFFGGTIDEVAIFSNALSQAEIKQVFYAANTGPYIIQQPQAPVGILIAGAPLTLTVGAAGPPTLGYQWSKDGANLAGKTDASFHLDNVTTNDAGNYMVVVTNAYGAATSAVVALEVTYPTAPAAFVRAVGYPAYDAGTKQASLTQVLLEFSGPLAAAGADPAHYTVSDGQNSLTVSGAQFSQNNLGVTLTTSAQTQGKLYTVTVTGVTDGVGNPLANNSAQFHAWVASPANGLLWEYFYGIEGTVVDATFTNNFMYPDHPAQTTNLSVFDTRAIFPDDTHDQYGTRIRGVFVPPTSGNWVFFMRSDDSSQAFLNANGADAAGKAPLMQENGCCEDWNKIFSAPIALVAGQAYYIETLQKEGGGGDYIKVAARLDGSGSPALGTANTVIDPASLVGPMIGYPYAPADAGGPLTLVGPDNVTNIANHLAVFTVQASNPANLPMVYQWNRNGSPIAGATDSTYAFLTTSADNTAKFTAQVAKIGSVVVSGQATLTVLPNTTPASVVAVHGTNWLNMLIVSFSEQMQASQNPAGFTISGFNVTGATLDWTGTNVTLTLDKALAPGQSFNLGLQNVPDAAGNMLTTTVAGQAAVFSRGLLQFDYFGGLSLTDVTLDWVNSDPRFPSAPDVTLFLTGFDSRTVFPDNSHSGYGDHISGVFVPPATGNYIFYVKSDDASRLSMNSSGLDPSASSTLAEAVCCPGFSANPSTPQALTGGQMYFIESLHKEGGGGDYIQAAAKLDSDLTNPDALLPLSPAVVGVLADPVGASVTITQQPASSIVAYLGAGTPRTLLDANFSASSGGFTVTNYAAPPGPWSWDSGNGSWTNFGPSACGGPFACGLRSPLITMTNKTSASLTFKHRYSWEFSDAFYDGGQVRISVNGGPFVTLAAGNFLQNGYNGPMQGTLLPTILTSPGFANTMFRGESPNYDGRNLLTTVASLGAFNAGDTVQLEFLACWDECSEGKEPNWEITAAQVNVGEALPIVASFAVGAESTYQGLPNPYMSYFWQKDTGAGFADIPDANAPNYTFNAAMSDSGSRFRCVVYSPGASATSAVATLTVTLSITFEQTSATTLKLSWPLPPSPLTSSSFVLEQTPGLSPSSWTPTPGQVQTTPTSVFMTVTINPTGPGLLYRLRKN